MKQKKGFRRVFAFPGKGAATLRLSGLAVALGMQSKTLTQNHCDSRNILPEIDRFTWLQFLMD